MAKGKKENNKSEENKAAEPKTEEASETVVLSKEEAEEVKALLSQVNAQAESLKQEQDKYLRLAAEYDNYRKRTQKEKESIYTDAKADTVTALLPVYDNLERALNQKTSDESFYKGVQMTMNQFLQIFEKLGVEEIEAEGKPFDPNFHNGVMHIEDENLGENMVAEVLQRGFKIGDKVLRFAMVKVAN